MTEEPQADRVGELEDVLHDEDFDLSEPPDAVRVSPSAIAAFAVGLGALWVLPQTSFFFFAGVSVRDAMAALIPVIAACIALRLSGVGEEEIFMSEGRLGGVGYCRAARALAFLTFAWIGLATAFLILANLPGDTLNFDL